jgi:hypothetical protein
VSDVDTINVLRHYTNIVLAELGSEVVTFRLFSTLSCLSCLTALDLRGLPQVNKDSPVVGNYFLSRTLVTLEQVTCTMPAVKLMVTCDATLGQYALLGCMRSHRWCVCVHKSDDHVSAAAMSANGKAYRSVIP